MKTVVEPVPKPTYLGLYYHDAYGTIRVYETNDRELRLRQGKQRWGPLRHLGQNVFELTWNGLRPGPVLVKFVLNLHGEATKLLMEGLTFAGCGPSVAQGLKPLMCVEKSGGSRSTQ